MVPYERDLSGRTCVVFDTTLKSKYLMRADEFTKTTIQPQTPKQVRRSTLNVNA